MNCELHPGAPVLVEWWSHRFIPSKHHAVVATYGEAEQWYEQGARMQVSRLDEALLRELSLTPPHHRS